MNGDTGLYVLNELQLVVVKQDHGVGVGSA